MRYARTGAVVARLKTATPDIQSKATDARAARLIHRAAFGATAAEIASVRSTGYRAWVESQLAHSARLPITDIATELGINTLSFSPQGAFTHYIFTSSAQLRMRSAYILNSIFNLNSTTTSADEYSATLAKWYGLPDVARFVVIPNISRFSHPDLGFMT